MNILDQIKEKIEGKESIYIDIISKAHDCTVTKAKQIFNAELETYIIRVYKVLNTPDKNDVYPQITVAIGVNIFLEAMQDGLSLSATSNHVYIARMKGSGINIAMQVTIDGKIYKAQKVGAIDHLSEPVIVMKDEDFKITNTADGRQLVVGDITFDTKEKFRIENMKVGYVYIIYHNGERELTWITGERLKELQGKSQNPTQYNDESMIQTKILAHALRKVRKSQFYKEIEATKNEVMAQNIEYDPIIETKTDNEEPF